jgi:subtilisin family serine protease
MGFLLALLSSAGAEAQLGPVRLPNLPNLGLPTGVARTVNGVTTVTAVSTPADARQARVQELLRTQRALIEADPNGNPILRAQITAFAPSAIAMQRAQTLGFTLVSEQSLEGLDARVVVLHAPVRWTTRRALNELRRMDPVGTYDFNHLYLESGAVAATPEPEPPASPPAAARTIPADIDATGIRVGLIDGGIELSHPVFSGVAMERYGCGGKNVSSAHGTAVASLLVGHSSEFRGAAPNAQLYAADVYCGLPTGGAVDAVVAALAWLARAGVPVINVSLVGPPNATLEQVVRMVVARGHLLVAAVGNDGPAAKPLYPAAYPGVVGVTAVDAKRHVLIEACRGPQVSFAAPGADMVAAAPTGTFAVVRGTSYAAPIVAGLLAESETEPNVQNAATALERLKRQAVDLGAPGADPVFGFGLVGEAIRQAPTAALLASQPAAITP